MSKVNRLGNASSAPAEGDLASKVIVQAAKDGAYLNEVGVMSELNAKRKE